MRACVAVTDEGWASFLQARPHLAEVNFWQPSPRTFRAVGLGQPFLFKSHYPSNRLVGGGFFSGWTAMPISRAWAYFGEGNAAPSLDDLRERIARYRTIAPARTRGSAASCCEMCTSPSLESPFQHPRTSPRTSLPTRDKTFPASSDWPSNWRCGT